jgi:uncharacterized membrane protein YhfC
MVVAPLTLTCLCLATLFVAVLPIVLYRRLRLALALNARDVISGIAVFALFAMVIERALNGYVLHQNETTAAWLSNPLAFVVYGALAAGVCEETGRFIAMRLLWRRAGAATAALTAKAAAPVVFNDASTDSPDAKSAAGPTGARSATGATGAFGAASATSAPRATGAIRSRNTSGARTRIAMRGAMSNPTSSGDGTALGYGGAEAWIVGVLVQIQWIVFAVVENRGQLDAYFGNVPSDSLMRIHLILASLSPQMAGVFLLERVAALIFQIGLSVLMWRGVRAGWRGILPLAILAHAVIDVPAALFQARVVPLYAVDGMYALLAVIVTAVLVKMFRRAALTTLAA